MPENPVTLMTNVESGDGDGNTTPPADTTIYSAPSVLSFTVWLTGNGLSQGDSLITVPLTSGGDYNALLKLADKNDVLHIYDISLKSGKKLSAAVHLTFALGTEYAGT